MMISFQRSQAYLVVYFFLDGLNHNLKKNQNLLNTYGNFPRLEGETFLKKSAEGDHYLPPNIKVHNKV